MKFIDWLITRGEKKMTHEKALREELRKDLDTMRREMAECRQELDSWKEKYFETKGREVER